MEHEDALAAAKAAALARLSAMQEPLPDAADLLAGFGTAAAATPATAAVEDVNRQVCAS